MNPYASNLDNDDPVEIVASTPKRLNELFSLLGENGAEKAWAPGKWTVRQIFCHLADCEIVFAFRLRQTLAEPHHIIQPFDQDKYAANYDGVDAGTALEVFTAVRNWNLKLIASLKPEAMSKSVTHPERGEMTLKTIVETMAGHDLNHRRQVEAAAGHAGAASAR